jgi:hypothetical protein
MSLILPNRLVDQQIAEERRGLVDHFNQEMEKVINKNKDKDKFWILGKLKFPHELGGKVGRVFLDASDIKPPLVRGSFVYEVDNHRGTKELLWWDDNNALHIAPTKKRYPVSPP